MYFYIFQFVFWPLSACISCLENSYNYSNKVRAVYVGIEWGLLFESKQTAVSVVFGIRLTLTAAFWVFPNHPVISFRSQRADVSDTVSQLTQPTLCQNTFP